MSYRVEQDSMGEVNVPAEMLYGAQTQRAVNNFGISTLTMPTEMINAIAVIKYSAAKANAELGLLDSKIAASIMKAAQLIVNGEYYDHFPVDVFQTGSGTSSNMNVNEVISSICKKEDGLNVSPNDHVNMSQSSNDVIPTAIHIATTLLVKNQLIPSLQELRKELDTKASTLSNVVKTGRTHLMDAMPLTFAQEISGWSKQVRNNEDRIESSLQRLSTLAQGGTALGTGINAHEDFKRLVIENISNFTEEKFFNNENFFEAISCQDTIVELSGNLKVIAVSLMKIANDLRFMNSGPITGLKEIELPSLQPGSSIMPGKVNPVIPEAVMMACAQVIGNDTTITVAGQSGNFQLNVMLPVIAYNSIQSIEILSNSCLSLSSKAIKGFKVNATLLDEYASKNPIVVTALNPIVGYMKAAEIAKKAYAESKPVIDVAEELTDLSREELNSILDPQKLTKGGIL